MFHPIIPCLLGFVFLLYKQHNRARGRQYPPGPKPEYYFFNDIPRVKSWLVYTELAKTYGPIFRLRTIKDDIVVLNTREAVEDVLVQRSNNYSSRPSIPLTDLMGWSWNLAFMPYADKWRKHRALIHKCFRPQASLSYRPLTLAHSARYSIHS
ncbi:hypothetical protein HGRIS_014473 [Hohenbuehelia grisea]|uniref:Cytochrome P450 n=1 Tax=Hohenbuehelia grisea TaxID=104357 RepID=A0ABR3JTJ2_9AGAR